jgi:hypothetical protein
VTITASFITDFWNDQLVEHGRQYLFLVLLGFVGSFGFIRLSTRLMRSPRVPWWPGSVVSEGGVHVHHMVFGIVTMMVAGVLSFALTDVGFWYDVSALLFGVGMGLTVDEFALWVYVEDVYWANEGRASIDATLITVAAMGLVLLGVAPFDVYSNSRADLIASLVVLVLQLWAVGVSLLKRRVFHGAVGLFVPPLAIYAASRIGKPDSPWAKRFYGERRPGKQAKAERRFRPGRRTERLKNSFRDLVGGVPESEYQARLAGETAETPEGVRPRGEDAAGGP